MIETLIQDKNSDILFINEANMMSTVTKEQRHIEGYKMVLPNTMESLGYARLVLLVNMDIEFKSLGNSWAHHQLASGYSWDLEEENLSK